MNTKKATDTGKKIPQYSNFRIPYSCSQYILLTVVNQLRSILGSDIFTVLPAMILRFNSS